MVAWPLRELLPTRQVKGEPFRRWYASPGADLIVWPRDDGSLIGFQFCYDKEYDEHAFMWLEASGHCHMAVDDGSSPDSWGKSTPFLVPNGAMDPGRILEIYRAESPFVPENYSAIVIARLQDLATTQG